MQSGRPGAARFVLATILIDAIGFGIVIPVLPSLVMIVGKTDLPHATRIGGWLMILYAVTQFLLGPTIGNLGDRFGRRPVLLGSLGGYAIDYLLMGFAPTLPWLFLGRALAGIFGGTYGPCQAALADITPPEERARLFGYVGAAFGIGFIVGPAIGGLLGEIGPRAPFYAAAALALINFIYGLTVFPETLAPENRRPFDWRRANPLGALLQLRKLHGLLPLAAVYLLWALANNVYPCTWSYYAIARFDWSPGMIGASLATTGVVMALMQVFGTGRIVKRFGERDAGILGLVAGTLGFVAYALIPQGWMVFPVMIFIGLQSLVMPALSAMMSQRATADTQGELQGFASSLLALGTVIAPLILNTTLAWWTSPAAPFRFAGAAFVVAALFAIAALVALRLTPRLAK